MMIREQSPLIRGMSWIGNADGPETKWLPMQPTQYAYTYAVMLF